MQLFMDDLKKVPTINEVVARNIEDVMYELELKRTIGLKGSIKTLPQKEKNAQRELIFDKIIDEIRNTVCDLSFRNKMIAKINFVRENKGYHTSIGAKEDETRILVGLYTGESNFYLEYNNDGKVIILETRDNRDEGSLIEKITYSYNLPQQKNQTYLDFSYIDSKDIYNKEHIREIKNTAIALAYDENGNILYKRVNNNCDSYILDNKGKQILIKSKNDIVTKTKIDDYILYTSTTKSYDNGNDQENTSCYLTKNTSATLVPDIDKKEISKEEYDKILNKELTPNEITSRLELKA